MGQSRLSGLVAPDSVVFRGLPIFFGPAERPSCASIARRNHLFWFAGDTRRRLFPVVLRCSGGIAYGLATNSLGAGHEEASDCRCAGRHRLFRQRFRSEEHTSELQSLMRISYAVFCLKKKQKTKHLTLDTKYTYK